ncbi:glycosyl hydrolase [Lederbergia galactosidilytica]|uniref:Uncharacterized protein n=1 Tax=Lederbergia galactosidilytica TaxID=217031 RepID=A0A177ZTN2_9BACI|nr:glycosyl hydrolase [Lederbergia galactosidilytica]OAK71262.1 hypothetical protein ABB05_10985 [Lederbergia galactosidilytica]
MLDMNTFQNPDAKYGIHPFWFWNGEMAEKEIERQIEEMADKRVTGFFLCARQGMSVPYLSDQWFQKVEYAVDIAAKHHMDVWLYDEYPYPSGMAGGEVTLEHPDAKQSILHHTVKKVDGSKKAEVELPWGKVLFAKAVPLDSESGERKWAHAIDVKQSIGNLQVEPVYQKTGLTTYNQKRFFTYNPKKIVNWIAPAGEWEIHCFLEGEINDFKYYGTFVDPCHTEAMATFIKMTHERYAQKLKKHFGKTIKGMFTDEIHLLGRYPWSPRFVPFIKQKYGYDIRDYLHLLLYQDGDLAPKIRYHYFQANHLLFRDAYHKQVHDWCEQYGLEYVAEVPSVRMAAQTYSHIPGGDSAHEKLGRSLDWILKRYFYSLRANPKMISSLSQQLGRERALIESFHSVGWSMTLQDAKWMIDRLAAFGVNFFNFHAFFYTLDAMVKHDAPPSQFLQNPYWQHYRKLGDYTRRMSYIMSEGTPVRPIAVLDPTTSLWTHLANPFTSFTYTGKDEAEKEKLEKLKQHWADLCFQLTTHYKDYDHLDPELLATAKISDRQMTIGNATYSLLIIPPITNLETDAWQKIKQFIEAGGTVIANGLLPYERIDEEEGIFAEIKMTFGLASEAKINFWEGEQQDLLTYYTKGERNAIFIPCTADHPLQDRIQTLFKIVDQYLQEEIQFKVKNDAKSFLLQQRRYDDRTEIVFLSNQEGDPHQAKLYMKRKDIVITKLNVETGEEEPLLATWIDDHWCLELDFAPYQSQLIKISENQIENNESFQKSESTVWKINAEDNWDVMPLQANMLRLAEFDLQLPAHGEANCTVQAKTFIDQCEDLANKHSLPVQFKQTFGTPMNVKMAYPINVSYRATFKVETRPSRCSLVMDRHAIQGKLHILINGAIVNQAHCHQKFVYDHNNIVCDIGPMIKQGENIVEVKGKIQHDWEGVVDPLYVKGDFGIDFSNDLQPILSDLPKNAPTIVGPYCKLPYYAGTIHFQRKVKIDRLPETASFTLQFSQFEYFHECAEVIVNGHSLGVKAWSPYNWEGKTSILSEGKNIVEVKVTNTLVGLLEGKYFDDATHTLKDVRKIDREKLRRKGWETIEQK